MRKEFEMCAVEELNFFLGL